MKTLMKLTRKELLKTAKPMVVNLQVAKTIKNKTQTRRVAKIRTDIDKKEWIDTLIDDYSRYKKNDVIWVREPARVSMINDIDSGELMFEYLADDYLDITDKKYQVNLHKIKTPKRFTKGGKVTAKWIRNCKGVPNGCIKEMARTFLKITDVRVEKLQNISKKDMLKEGAKIDSNILNKTENQATLFSNLTDNFIKIWNSTAQKGYKWEDNPYVFVYEFEKIEEVA